MTIYKINIKLCLPMKYIFLLPYFVKSYVHITKQTIINTKFKQSQVLVADCTEYVLSWFSITAEFCPHWLAVVQSSQYLRLVQFLHKSMMHMHYNLILNDTHSCAIASRTWIWKTSHACMGQAQY